MSKKTGAAFRPVDIYQRRSGKPKKDLRVPIIAALILVLIAVIAFFVITGRDDSGDVKESTKKENAKEEVVNNSESLEGVCRDFFDAYTSCDSVKTGQMLDGIGDPFAFGELTSLLASNTEVEIGETKILDESTATVAITMTTIDLVKVITETTDEYSSKEEASAALKAALNADAPKKSFDVDVKLIKNDEGQWKVVITDEFSDAMMGGLISYLTESEVTQE